MILQSDHEKDDFHDKENNDMSVCKEEFKELVDKFNSLNKELNELSTKIKDYEQETKRNYGERIQS